MLEALKVIIKYPDWGGEKLSQYLLQKEVCYLSPSTMNRIKSNLKQYLDLENLNYTQRYEFLHPNDCWALDFLEFKWKNQTLYLCFILDDKSRYILDWSITSKARSKFVQNLLSKAFKKYGKPKAVKSDNGPQFRKQFQEFLNSWLVKHHVSPYFSPSYNGKVERKNRDLNDIIEQVDQKEKSMEELFTIIGNSIYEHNYIRPHQSLEGVTPYQSYMGFEDKVKAKMEAFKKREKERKGFKTKNQIITPEKEKSKNGEIVSAYLINDPDTIVGCVNLFIEF